ncbi:MULTISPECIES: hypothetical protein [unclassified Pseudomonas]|uniref:hypothetical protein n=1 Tax=unclassified Pseudomonas TaxID=196821 RepID=UPI001CE123B2
MGHACGRHRVARLMRKAGLRVRSRKRWRLVSSSRHALPIAPDQLDRQFVSDRANRLGSRQPILRVRLPGLTSATSNRAQPFTSRELLGQRRDGELLPFAEG